MALSLSTLFVLIALLGYKKFKYLLNPITAMFSLWASVLLFSDQGLYQTTIPNDRVYGIIFIGMMAYLLGVILSSGNVVFRLRKERDRKDLIKKRKEYRINYFMIYILDAIAIVYYLIQLVAVIRLLISGQTYGYIRRLNSMGEENTLYSSYFIYLVKVFIAIPSTYLTIALFPVELFFGKRRKSLIIEAIALMLLFVLTTGGRSVIIWIAIYFACSFTLYKRRNKKKGFRTPRRIKYIIAAGLFLLIAFMYIMTISRKGNEVDLFKQVFIYYVAPIRHFDIYIDIVDGSGMLGYGLASFYGLIYPILFLLRLSGVFSNYPEFVNTIHYMSFQMLEKGKNIGGNIYMNAFATVFYQPYLDGRITGVVICLFVFGIMCGRSFSKAYYQNNMRSVLLYNILLQQILCSIVRFYFTQQSQAICFILALFAIRTFVVQESSVKEMQ